MSFPENLLPEGLSPDQILACLETYWSEDDELRFQVRELRHLATRTASRPQAPSEDKTQAEAAKLLEDVFHDPFYLEDELGTPPSCVILNTGDVDPELGGTRPSSRAEDLILVDGESAELPDFVDELLAAEGPEFREVVDEAVKRRERKRAKASRLRFGDRLILECLEGLESRPLVIKLATVLADTNPEFRPHRTVRRAKKWLELFLSDSTPARFLEVVIQVFPLDRRIELIWETKKPEVSLTVVITRRGRVWCSLSSRKFKTLRTEIQGCHTATEIQRAFSVFPS